jgi:hypothetical protein
MPRIIPYRVLIFTTSNTAESIRQRLALELVETTGRTLVGYVDVHRFKVWRNERDGRKDKTPIAVGQIGTSISGQTEVRVVIRLRWFWIVLWALALAVLSVISIELLLHAVWRQVTWPVSVGPVAMAVGICVVVIERFRWEAAWLERLVRECVLGE